jgi:hypothetical protein
MSLSVKAFPAFWLVSSARKRAAAEQHIPEASDR